MGVGSVTTPQAEEPRPISVTGRKGRYGWVPRQEGTPAVPPREAAQKAAPPREAEPPQVPPPVAMPRETRVAPAGWYRDPADFNRGRFWDGTRWTGHAIEPLSEMAAVRIRSRADTAVVLAAAGLLGALLPVFGFIFGVTAPIGLGLAFSARAMKVDQPEGVKGPTGRRAIVAAIIMGALGSALWALWGLVWVYAFTQGSDPFVGL